MVLCDLLRTGEIGAVRQDPAKVSGSSSAVERQLPKLDVAGSIPVSRSINSKLKSYAFRLVCNIHKLIHKSWRLIQGVQSFDRSPRHLLADVSVLLRNGCGHVAHHVLHHLQWRAEFRLSSDECVPQIVKAQSRPPTSLSPD